MSRAPNLRARTAAAVADQRLMAALHLATWRKVEARAESMQKLPHVEALRERAAQIRQHTLEHLPEYLDQFVARVTALGVCVHFAANAASACQIVCEIAAQRGLKLAVKSKSMTTEEVELNRALSEAGDILVRLFHPMMPHLAEECWAALGHSTLVATEDWPQVEIDLLVENTITLPVQVNGKKRADVTVARDAGKGDIEAAVLALDAVKRALDGKSPKKVIVVPQRIVNVVA
jgi:leucyl-tRNA synthetase